MHQRRNQQDRIADDVRHRQHAVDPIRGTGIAHEAGGSRRDQQVEMAEHHPFRRARRAGRVHQRRDLARGVRLDRLGHRILVQRPDADAAERADRTYRGPCPPRMVGGLLGQRHIE
jgi:hypothetical protein